MCFVKFSYCQSIEIALTLFNFSHIFSWWSLAVVDLDITLVLLCLYICLHSQFTLCLYNRWGIQCWGHHNHHFHSPQHTRRAHGQLLAWPHLLHWAFQHSSPAASPHSSAGKCWRGNHSINFTHSLGCGGGENVGWHSAIRAWWYPLCWRWPAPGTDVWREAVYPLFPISQRATVNCWGGSSHRKHHGSSLVVPKCCEVQRGDHEQIVSWLGWMCALVCIL